MQDFFAAYFHQDWEDDASSPEEVVQNYLASASDVEIASLASEIERLLSGHMNEDQLDEMLFRELGCFYSPTADGLTPTAWLNHLVERFRRKASTI